MDGGDPRYAVGSFMHQGGRDSQEDGVVIEVDFNLYIHKVAKVNNMREPKVDASVPRTIAVLLDGHGGASCMNYVQNRIIPHVALCYLKNPRLGWPEAIQTAITTLERRWLRKAPAEEFVDRSGTTLTVCVIEGNKLHCGWVGDSPCWLQKNDGSTQLVTRPHRPQDRKEVERILDAGGEIRRKEGAPMLCFLPPVKSGPERVYPGGLNITRSLGDVRCKLEQYGGCQGVIIGTPEVASVDLGCDTSHIVLCSDGLSDNLRNGPRELYRVLKTKHCNDQSTPVEPTPEMSPGPSLDMNVMAETLAEKCVRYGMRKSRYVAHQDNTTAIVICVRDK